MKVSWIFDDCCVWWTSSFFPNCYNLYFTICVQKHKSCVNTILKAFTVVNKLMCVVSFFCIFCCCQIVIIHFCSSAASGPKCFVYFSWARRVLVVPVEKKETNQDKVLTFSLNSKMKQMHQKLFILRNYAAHKMFQPGGTWYVRCWEVFEACITESKDMNFRLAGWLVSSIGWVW